MVDWRGKSSETTGLNVENISFFSANLLIFVRRLSDPCDVSRDDTCPKAGNNEARECSVERDADTKQSAG